MDHFNGKHHLKGLPALADFIMPQIEARELYAIFIGAIDAAKERSMEAAVKETLRRVFIVLDEVTFTCGKIEMKTEQLKALIQEAIK